MDSQKKTILFWSLVIGIFLIIFLLWIPQFVQSVKTLTSAVQTQSTSQTSSFQQEWTARTDEMKKKLDALLKQTQTLTNTATVSDGESQPPQQ